MNLKKHKPIDITAYLLSNGNYSLVGYTPRGRAFLGTDRVLNVPKNEKVLQERLARKEGLRIAEKDISHLGT